MMEKFAYFVILFHSCTLFFVKANGAACDVLTCSATEIHPVCGSDGKTYQSKCLLKLHKCTSEIKLRTDYTGPCRKNVSPKLKARSFEPLLCTEERKRAFKSIKEKHLLKFGIHIPKCDSDGSYSRIQCHKYPDFCWCVDKYGRENGERNVLGKEPLENCRKRPTRSHPLGSEKYSRILKGCSKENRISFNKKTVTMFKKEMTKLSQKNKGKLNVMEIIQWKMQELDVDKNGHLQHKEIKALIKKLKKAYSPRKCGKTLFYYCDKNQDYTISKNEWLACLGYQGSTVETSSKPDVAKCSREHKIATQLQAKNPDPTRFIPSCNANGKFNSVQCQELSKYCWCVDSITGRNIPNSSVKNAKPNCTKHSRPTKTASHFTYKYALLTPRIIRKPQNIPAKIDRPTKHERGKKMKRKTNMPSSLSEHKDTMGAILSLSECDDVSWSRFSHELVQLLRKELESMTGPKVQVKKNSSRQQSPPLHLLHAISQQPLPDTMILGWKFSQLDIDSDRLVDSHEFFASYMKKVFGRIRRGRKCSKRLFDTCDFDKNKGLSLNEWRKCLRRKTPKSKSPGSSKPGFLGR